MKCNNSLDIIITGGYLIVCGTPTIFIHVVFVFTGLAVASEVKKILSPRLPPSAASYPAKGVSLIERRPKRKGKSKQANLKYGAAPPPEKRGRKCMQTFQKKLVVVEFTGDDQPCKFTLKEYMVLARGMLPEIGLEESEEEIRKKIAETLRDTLACLLTDDFEFL